MSHDAVLDEHLLSLVQNQEIREQSELQNRLRARGYDIPQATLSRRLKKLKIAKVAGIYTVIDTHLSNLPAILNVKVSEFGLMVLHTNPGNASSLAYFLDQKFVTFHPLHPKNTGILGTIAGDDTVLVIIENKSQIEHVNRLLQETFPYLVQWPPNFD